MLSGLLNDGTVWGADCLGNLLKQCGNIVTDNHLVGIFRI